MTPPLGVKVSTKGLHTMDTHITSPLGVNSRRRAPYSRPAVYEMEVLEI